MHPSRRPPQETKATPRGCLGVLLLVVGFNWALFFWATKSSDETFPGGFAASQIGLGAIAIVLGVVLLARD